MLQRLILTVATAVSLTGLYIVYSVAMRPIVVIPKASEKRMDVDDSDVQRPVENTRVAKKYIPEKRWPTATNCKYMLRSEEGFVYTDSWNPDKENSKRVLFKPFAIVWLTKDKDGKEQAITVVSDEAKLEFASKFDEKNQNPGRIVGAVLKGAVDIAGPDGLSVQGSDFHFEEEGLRLYSHNPVWFQFQSNTGSAFRMDMKLIPAEGPPGNDRPHIFGIETIHLTGRPKRGEYVTVNMQLPQGEETRPAKARCSGDLIYTVATNTAVMTTDVIVRTGATKHFDQMECDRLTMQFVPKKTERLDEVAESAPVPKDGQPRTAEYQKIESKLEFSWLEAVQGKNAPVKILSPSNGVIATMSRFTYNEDTRTVVMSSDGSANDVKVTRNGSTLNVPEIEVQMDEPKKNVSSLICRGKGELKYFDEETGRLAYVASWLKHLRKNTDPATNLDLVELDGGALFGQPKPDRRDSSGLTAERIKIWLAPMDLGLPANGSEGDNSSKAPEPKPKRILAQREVRLRSPQIEIKRTDELDIRFDDDVESHPAPITKTNRIQSPRSRSAMSGKRQVGFASVPTEPLGSLGPPVEIPFEDSAQSESLSRSQGRSQARQSHERTFVSANWIGVQVRRVSGTQEIQPKAVLSKGKVEITQERKAGEKPLILTGDQVDLQMESQAKLVAYVQGTPARIRDRGFEIEGKDLHLDRGANRAWVAGAGILQLPLPANREIPGLDAAARRELVVHWDESMNFNGLDAEFLGNVEAKLGHARMTCGQMIVELVKPISFHEEKFDTEPALKTIRCREKVEFKNSTYEERNVIEVYRGKVGDFTLNYVTGTVVAQGPGEIYAWQRHEKNGRPGQRDSIQANRPIPSEVTVWDYTRVQFEGRLKANFDGQATGQSTRQSVKIFDRVEVVYGPVKQTLDQINPDNLPSKAGTLRCDKLEFVNHPVTERNPNAYREFVGLGNAEIEGQVEGRQFTASADEISFDESKGLYSLHAHGQQKARLTGIGSGNLIGRWIQFNPDPKLRILKVDGAVEGQGSQ